MANFFNTYPSQARLVSLFLIILAVNFSVISEAYAGEIESRIEADHRNFFHYFCRNPGHEVKLEPTKNPEISVGMTLDQVSAIMGDNGYEFRRFISGGAPFFRSDMVCGAPGQSGSLIGHYCKPVMIKDTPFIELKSAHFGEIPLNGKCVLEGLLKVEATRIHELSVASKARGAAEKDKKNLALKKGMARDLVVSKLTTQGYKLSDTSVDWRDCRQDDGVFGQNVTYSKIIEDENYDFILKASLIFEENCGHANNSDRTNLKNFWIY